MEIREAFENDIPGIISVLKASLGESSSQKTETVWRYKHLDNPFGKSMILVADEKGVIIGVRAFMRWKWQIGTEEFSAFRAVDTATHPDHQGKGIFKKLTLKALEIAKQQGDDFVFNTPNSQSKPGYLKMGWQEAGKVKILVWPVNPVFWREKNRYDTNVENSLPQNIRLQLEINHIKKTKESKLFTPKSVAFMKWRYLNNPIQKYLIFATESFFIASYVKKHKSLRELRISELLIFNEKGKSQVKNQISFLVKNYGVHFMSMSPQAGIKFFGSLKGNFGPTLTLREINLEEEEKHLFLNLNTWSYSLGDLELF